MAEIHFYGPVQGMVRINDAIPRGDSEARELAALIKKQGCAGCPRLNASQIPNKSSSFPCDGVGWINPTTAILFEHQGHPVHVSGSEPCQLIRGTITVPDGLIIQA
ncbi:MAG: hypothetical protein AAB481_01860 [Patescibacteria group bacterium]